MMLCRPNKEVEELMVPLAAHEVAQGRWVMLNCRQHNISSPKLQSWAPALDHGGQHLQDKDCAIKGEQEQQKQGRHKI